LAYHPKLVKSGVTDYIVSMESRKKRRRSIKGWPILPTTAVDPVMRQRIEEHRFRAGHPNLAEAVRDLIQKGLDAATPERQPKLVSSRE
jgi:hypothetical protein